MFSESGFPYNRVRVRTPELHTPVWNLAEYPQASNPARVLSGVFGPLLFLLHINDLPSIATSSVCLFADDCLPYLPICCATDQVALQRDLTALQHWGDTWGIRFNAGKCHIMQVHRGQPLVHFYLLCGHVLSPLWSLPCWFMCKFA